MTVAIETRDRPKVSIWNDPRVRSIFVQVALLIIVFVLFYVIVENTYSNLKSRHIASGYGFLGKTAGFDIIQSLIPYSSASSYGTAIVVGLLNTILISILGIVAATIIGFLVGIMRLSRNWVVSRIAVCYIEFFRNVPLLLQVFLFYGAVLQPLPGPKQAVNFMGSWFLSNRGLMMPKPVFGDGAWLMLAGLIVAIGLIWLVRRWAHERQMATGQPFPVFWASMALLAGLPLIGLAVAGFPLSWDYPELAGFNFKGGLTVTPELMALLLALAIYTGADIAESVRAGIEAVSHGQSEAAHALGLRHGTTLRLVIIPQAMRIIIPPLASTYLSLTKNSSLGIAVGYPDIVATGGTVLNQSGQAIEIVAIWMAVYLSLSLLTSMFMNWYNARMKLVER